LIMFRAFVGSYSRGLEQGLRSATMAIEKG
jgi:hypothetical protein